MATTNEIDPTIGRARTPSELQAMALRGTPALAPKSDPLDDVVASALLKLAEKLGAPAAVQSQIKELKSASENARTEQAALAKLRADTAHEIANARAEHDAAIAKELADHEKALAAGRAELDAAKKQAADLLAQAKHDAEIAARLKDRAAKKLAAFDAA